MLGNENKTTKIQFDEQELEIVLTSPNSGYGKCCGQDQKLFVLANDVWTGVLYGCYDGVRRHVECSEVDKNPEPSLTLADGDFIPVCDDGFLRNLAHWDEEIALAIAKREQVELTSAHWEVINFLRFYYDDYKIAPMIRILTKAIGRKLGREKGNTKYLYDLYPGGLAKQACKIAGLPKPTGCCC